MTKLVIQIPAYNEAETLPLALADLPRQIDGVDEIQVVVIDDGSTDNTAQVALANGADYVIRHRQNRGLVLATASMNPLNFLVLLIKIGPYMSAFNLSRNKIAMIQTTMKKMR